MDRYFISYAQSTSEGHNRESQTVGCVYHKRRTQISILFSSYYYYFISISICISIIIIIVVIIINSIIIIIIIIMYKHIIGYSKLQIKENYQTKIKLSFCVSFAAVCLYGRL